MVWEPKKGCFCCLSPRTATLILGYLEVFLSALTFLGSVTMVISSMPNIGYESYMMLAFIPMGLPTVEGVFAALLILGVNKRNLRLMLPYMIWHVLRIVVMSIVTAMIFSFLMINKLWVFASIVLLIGGLLTFYLTYISLVIRVCYKEVKVQQLAKNNVLELGAIHHNDLSVSNKFMREISGAPPAYRTTEYQPAPYPNHYMQPLSPYTYSPPPPNSKLGYVPTVPYSM